ncbi:MAG: hypothetical protein SO160_11475 [Lachnospiraceae bacterium]|nr:hypothetical protein [Lachnospiraceae bacterium]
MMVHFLEEPDKRKTTDTNFSVIGRQIFPHTAVPYLRDTKKTPDRKKYTKLQKEVGDLMSGAMLETEARRFRDEYLQVGVSQGISQVAENMIRAQKPAEEIKSMTGFSIDKLKEIVTKIGVMLVL